MIVTSLFTALEYRHLPAAVVIIGSSSGYTVAWTVLKVATFPFGQAAFHRAEDTLYAAYQWMQSFFFDKWSGVEYVFYGDDLPKPNENVLYLSNHQSAVDWVLAENLALRAGAGGHVRYILKDSIRFIPLYGYFLYKHGCVYVRRKEGDRNMIGNQLRALVSQKRPLWLCLFPEGTRFTEKKAEGSRSFAQLRNLPLLKHVLLPKSKGFEVSLEAVGDYFDAVYDFTIFYEGQGQCRIRKAPGMFEFFSGRWRRVHVHIHRTSMSAFPKDTLGRKEWLYKCFEEKDRLLAQFKGEEVPLPVNQQVDCMSGLKAFGSLSLGLLSLAGLVWPYSRVILVSSAVIYTLWGILGGMLFQP